MTARVVVDVEPCDECGGAYAVDRLATVWQAGVFVLMCARCIDELRVRLMEASNDLP